MGQNVTCQVYYNVSNWEFPLELADIGLYQLRDISVGELKKGKITFAISSFSVLKG